MMSPASNTSTKSIKLTDSPAGIVPIVHELVPSLYVPCEAAKAKYSNS